MKKDLSYVCNYLKALVIPYTLSNFTVAERFQHGLTDEDIRKGIVAFRNFLYNLFDRLSAGKDEIDVKTGSKYDPYGYKGDTGNGNYGYCFPVIFDLTIILFSLGTHGRIEATKPNIKFTVRGEDLLTVICPITEKYHSLIKMSNVRKLEMFRLLSDMGLHFNGADFSQEVDFSKTNTFHVTYEKDDYWGVGLKLIAEATANHKYYIKMENMFYPVFLRCDFYPLANTVPKKCNVNIQEYANGQHPDIKEWIIYIDKFLTANGCTMILGGHDTFTYVKRNTSMTYGMVCRIHMRITGCFITPGVNHLMNPNNIISMLPDNMVDMIKSGEESTKFDIKQCHRRTGNMSFAGFNFTHKDKEYEGCRHAGLRCQFAGVKCRFSGYEFDLATADNRELMRKWLEMELI